MRRHYIEELEAVRQDLVEMGQTTISLLDEVSRAVADPDPGCILAQAQGREGVDLKGIIADGAPFPALLGRSQCRGLIGRQRRRGAARHEKHGPTANPVTGSK